MVRRGIKKHPLNRTQHNYNLEPMQKPIVVVGAVRNGERTVFKEYHRIKKALGNFEQVHFFVVESDSTDRTVEKLEQLKKEGTHFNYTSLGNLAQQFPKRTARLAHCRNTYLTELKNPKYSTAQYVLVADLDGTNNLLSKEGVQSCWDFEGWDVCTANQKGLYYDVWALRHPFLSPNDCWAHYDFVVENFQTKSLEALTKTVRSRQFRIPRHAKPIEVASAFGGLALYKKETLKNARYTGLDAQGREVCEHVPFHQQIQQQGYKIFINPKLINCRPPKEHTQLSIKRRLLHWAEALYPGFPKSKLFAHLKKKHQQ